jgi:hypothetical protein
MRWIALALLVLCGACGVAPQPESLRTVAAFEVPLPNAEERTEFLAVLSAAAEAEGFHVDAADADDLQMLSKALPMNIHAAVWRGADDDEVLAGVDDMGGHLGRAWITFSRGEDPRLASRFRERAMRRILARWPSTQSLPILPTGGIPLAADIRLTPEGYRVKPEAASRYQLPPSSPLIARN